MATFYLDYEGGSDANNGTTFALRWKTLTSGATSARIAPGDTIRIMGSPAPTSLGMSASWTNQSKTVTLNSALTSNIDMGETAWTASANVTATKNTSDYKENTGSSSIAIAAGFTTGLAAYRASANTDYSAYKQVSFWIKQTSGTVAVAGDVSIRLCSDTLGATSVTTIAIPALVVLNRWVPITVDTGAALPASVGSVALYVDTDRGAQTFLIDNIIACKDSTSADSLTLTSLIGKNTTNETWYGIQSIDGTTVKLDNGTATVGNAGQGYSGTTETVTTYKRETIKTSMAAAVGTVVQSITDSGTSGSLITFSGGWNRTDMSTQDSDTWFDGQNGFGIGIQIPSRTYTSIDKVSAVRYGTAGIQTSNSSYNTISNAHLNNCTTSGFGDAGTNLQNTFTDIYTFNNSSTGFLMNLSRGCLVTDLITRNNLSLGMSIAGSSYAGIYTNITSVRNTSTGIQLAGNSYLDTATVDYNGSNGFAINSLDVTVLNASANNNTSYAYNMSGSDNSYIYNCSSSASSSGAIINTLGTNGAFNCSFSESTEFGTPTDFQNSRFISIKHDQTADNHYIATDGGTITSTTSVRHTASGIAWKFSPTSVNRNVNYPLNNTIATIACNASSLVTVKCWFYRSHANLVGTLRCRGGQISGVSSDVTSSMTVGATTWEELTITFTPNEAGVVEIEALFYASDGVTTYSGYIDDMTISQA